MHRIAKTLGLDPLGVIRRNLVPKDVFPYRAAAGSLLDSGDCATALDIATGDGRLARLRARRDAARAEGRRFGLGVEVEDTGRVRIDEYVTMHDAGRRLNPALVDGQIRGGFAHGLGAALYEEFAYADDGSFLSGTFADYLVPTACEVPNPTILHMEPPSPFTPLGAKGVGEGNTMSTPVCLANAVADALGINDVELPMTPAKVRAWFAGEEPPPPE